MWGMSKLPNILHQKTISEKSQHIHSLSDKEAWDMTPTISFIFYYTKNDDGDQILDKYTLYKNSKFSKSHINMIEGWYGFLKWDDILGSQKIINYIKSI